MSIENRGGVRTPWIPKKKYATVADIFRVSVPFWIRCQRTDHDQHRCRAAADHIAQGHRSRRLQAVRREPVGRRPTAVRHRPLGLYPRQPRVELCELAVADRHATPFVQTRQKHGPDVHGSSQLGWFRDHEQLNGHQNGDRRDQDENQRAIRVEQPKRPSGKVARGKHADPAQDDERQVEKFHRSRSSDDDCGR